MIAEKQNSAGLLHETARKEILNSSHSCVFVDRLVLPENRAPFQQRQGATPDRDCHEVKCQLTES
jgi:hypothetical protein